MEKLALKKQLNIMHQKRCQRDWFSALRNSNYYFSALTEYLSFTTLQFQSQTTMITIAAQSHDPWQWRFMFCGEKSFLLSCFDNSYNRVFFVCQSFCSSVTMLNTHFSLFIPQNCCESLFFKHLLVCKQQVQTAWCTSRLWSDTIIGKQKNLHLLWF